MVWGETPGYSWPKEKHAIPARFVHKLNCSKLLWELGGCWACGSFALHFCFLQEVSAAANQVIHSGKFKEQQTLGGLAGQKQQCSFLWIWLLTATRAAESRSPGMSRDMLWKRKEQTISCWRKRQYYLQLVCHGKIIFKEQRFQSKFTLSCSTRRKKRSVVFLYPLIQGSQ